MSLMQGHRNTQATSQAVQGGRATGAQHAQRAAGLQPCGPAAPGYYIVINGNRLTLDKPDFGAGPSTAPPCADPSSHVYLGGGGLLHVDMFAHNKSGIAYQNRNRRPGTVVNHSREPHRQPRLPPSYTKLNVQGRASPASNSKCICHWTKLLARCRTQGLAAT